MASLRAELTGRPDPGEPVLMVNSDTVRENAGAAPEPAIEPEPPVRSGRTALAFALILSAFWIGASAAFLFGFFGPEGLVGLGPHILAFAASVAFLPPFLFIASAYALVRAQAMGDVARRLALASERLMVADDSAVASTQRLGRAVRRELDALSQGLDAAYGRMRAIEKVLEERIAQLDEAGARAGVKTDAIAQRLREERDGIEQMASGLELAASRAADTLSTRGAQLKMSMDVSGNELRATGQTIAETLEAATGRASEVLAGHSAELKLTVESTGDVLQSTTKKIAEFLDQAALQTAETLVGHSEELRATIQLASAEVRIASEKAASDLSQAATQASDDLSSHQSALKATLQNASGEMRATTRQLIDDIGQAASQAAEMLSGRTGQLRANIDSSTGELRGSTQQIAEAFEQTLARATETLAGRGAQLKAMIEATAGELRAAGLLLEEQSHHFTEAAERAAGAPHAAAVELDRQSKLIEGVADTAVARAEFVLARQERQRQAMQELLTRLKEESGSLETILVSQSGALERATNQLAKESQRLDELSDQGLRRLEAAMGSASARTAQLAAGFGRETDRVKEAADGASAAMARLVESLREATTSAQALIADSTADAKRHAKDFVGEAMGQCDQLLRAATTVAEEAEKARAALSKAADEAERHIVKIPGVAAQEAERVREALRGETERMLDISARALATIQTRSSGQRIKQTIDDSTSGGETPAAPTEPQSEGLRGLARRITAPKRRVDEKPDLRQGRGSYALSDVLAAAEASDSTPRLKSGATAALGQLQSALADLAVDLDTAMSGTENPQMWRSYLDGDKGVFARRLAGSIGPEIVDRISALYRDNSRFHEAADAYLAEFETLLTRARDGDRGGLLASSLLSADTGKIYLAVAYALGRLE